MKGLGLAITFVAFASVLLLTPLFASVNGAKNFNSSASVNGAKNFNSSASVNGASIASVNASPETLAKEISTKLNQIIKVPHGKGPYVQRIHIDCIITYPPLQITCHLRW